MKTKTTLAAGLLLLAAIPGSVCRAGPAPVRVSSPVTTDNFLLRTTADLVSLCSARPDDPNRIAAIHFCEGFILGVRHYDDVSQAALKDSLYCQDQRVTRDQGAALFVQWHLANPQYGSETPLDGVVRWAMAQWPCPQQTRTGKNP